MDGPDAGGAGNLKHGTGAGVAVTSASLPKVHPVHPSVLPQLNIVGRATTARAGHPNGATFAGAASPLEAFPAANRSHSPRLPHFGIVRRHLPKLGPPSHPHFP